MLTPIDVQNPPDPTAGEIPPGAGADPYAADKSGMQREAPDVPPARRQHVRQVLEMVQNGKRHWAGRFKRMKAAQDFVASLQWSKSTEDDRYVANITQRHVATKVAALYAKNPRFVARRRPQLDFALWDEKPASIQMAMQGMQQGAQMGMPPDPQQAAVLQDAAQGFQLRQLHDRIARTLEIVAQYTVDTQQPTFKQQMKSTVRRAVINGVAYVKLCFQRDTEPRPEVAAQIADINERLARIERMKADLQDGETSLDDAEASELQATMKALAEQPEIVSREGVFFDYPDSTSIIPDPKTKALRSFIGAEWVAQEYCLSPNRVKEIYGVDMGCGYTPYVENPDGQFAPRTTDPAAPRKDDDKCLVFEVYHKGDGVRYVVVDGYPDFLHEPCAPEVTLERFWPWFTLVLNEVEHEKEVIPPSDVDLLRPMQKEYNRARQGLREHRLANRPKMAVAAGVLEDADKEKLKNHPANAVLELKGLAPGQKVDELLQPIKGPAIDPALYDTSFVFDDMQRVVGSQEADLGGTSGSTATESSIAETGRMSTLQSNTDDLDDFLTDIGTAMGQVLLAEFDQATVAGIAGPGAVWPQLTQTDIQKQIYLEMQVGSSGRPNKTTEVQAFQQLAPILLQIPGVDPAWLAREAIKRMDDRLDVTDALAAGMPSISALNAILAKGGGIAAAPEMVAAGAGAAQAQQGGQQGGQAAPGAGAGDGQAPAAQGHAGAAQGAAGAMNAPGTGMGGGNQGPSGAARAPVPGDSGFMRV